MSPRRRGPLVWVAFVLFVVMPLVELYVIIQVGRVIGPWWTIGLLLLDSVIGAWLVRREGSTAWRALRSALSSGRMPAKELADAALILVGGTLMLAPGFVTDLLGFFFILPFTRPIARRALTAVVARRLVVIPGGTWPPTGRTGGPGDARRPGAGPAGPVVRGDVVDE